MHMAHLSLGALWKSDGAAQLIENQLELGQQSLYFVMLSDRLDPDSWYLGQ